MRNIIKLRTNTDNVLEFLDSIKEEVINGNIDNMMIACKCNDGSIMTGYTNNLNYGTKMVLLGHVQSDIIKDMIDENYIVN